MASLSEWTVYYEHENEARDADPETGQEATEEGEVSSHIVILAYSDVDAVRSAAAALGTNQNLRMTKVIPGNPEGD